jgi:hypothetical protein
MHVQIIAEYIYFIPGLQVHQRLSLRALKIAKSTSSNMKLPVQPVGQYYFIMGRMFGYKCLYSLMVNDRKVQYVQEDYVRRRREESTTVGQRLRRNAPQPIEWTMLESTWHEHLSKSDLT